MLSLRDLQTEFRTAALKNNSSSLADAIIENNFSVAQQLQIYHNNILTSLTEALQSIYTNIQRLVGEDFFVATARIYIPNHLPHTGTLIEFASDFAEFLANFEHTKSMDYLVDIAKIDWACHQIYHAKDSHEFDLNQLREIPEDYYEKLIFELNPASCILKSRYPVLRILQLCMNEQDGSAETVDLTEGGDNILIIRRVLDISFEKLNEAEFTFLTAINAKKVFSTVVEETLNIDSNFDINGYLQKCLMGKVIVDFKK